MKTNFRRSSFDALPQWSSHNFSEISQAFSFSCQVFLRENFQTPFPNWISTNAFKKIASTFLKQNFSSDSQLRAFFETYFEVYKIQNSSQEQGIFTGYYEPELEGSMGQSKDYPYPLYAVPSDLLFMSDLGVIDPNLKGVRWAGRRGEDGQVYPYWSREDIYKGILEKSNVAKVLCWLKDPIDLFFLQVQGSGKIQLKEGGSLRVGYAASNGYPYISLGKKLKEEIQTSQLMTKEILESYLRSLPIEGKGGLLEKLSLNSLFIFFKETKDAENLPGPIGTLGKEQGHGIPLTPGRSLAVDPLYIPLGLPMWGTLDEKIPEDLKMYSNRLYIAQDTGGAIKGPIRGDIYFGTGKEAGFLAGQMNYKGQAALFIPKN